MSCLYTRPENGPLKMVLVKHLYLGRLHQNRKTKYAEETCQEYVNALELATRDSHKEHLFRYFVMQIRAFHYTVEMRKEKTTSHMISFVHFA